MKVTISRKAHFNAAHRLYRKDWTFEKNDAVFGKCNNPNFHGHNYEMIVSVTGPIDPETGYVMDVKILSDLIKAEIEEQKKFFVEEGGIETDFVATKDELEEIYYY